MKIIDWLRGLFTVTQTSPPELQFYASNGEEAVLVPVRILRLIEFGARTGQFSDEMQEACEEARAIIGEIDEKNPPVTRDGWKAT